MKKYNVLVVFGGVSSEHKISEISAASVIRNINRDKYNVFKMGITEDGDMRYTQASPEKIENGTWVDDKTTKFGIISPQRSVHGICIVEDGVMKTQKIDAVFPVLHGKNGEDGSIQGLFQLADLPFVGPGVEASACSMDKAFTKIIVEKTGIRQAKTVVSDRVEFSEQPNEIIAKIEKTFSGIYPLFVKPSSAGSSVGVSRVTNRNELFDAIVLALNEDYKVLIEEAIVGREIEVAVLGNRNVRTSCIGEILADDGFYDYEAKYENNATETRVVRDLNEEKEQEIQAAAAAIYKALGCKGLSRVDFFLKDDGEVVFNEINTIPGFTGISMYPQLWAASGIEYSALIDELFMLAMDEIE